MNKTKQKVILLVEDDFIIALAETESIKGFGYRVVSAHTGEKAVELALSDPKIDLVLMDIDLGRGIDGPEAARRILDKRNLPIVFLTSHLEREFVERVKEITRYGYVIKNSGNFVLESSIEMAFELFSAHTCTAAAQRRMEKIQSIAHIGNWIWDIKSDELSWSDEMYRIFGIAKENFSGSLEKTIEEAIHPEDRQKVKESNESVAMKSKPIPLEYRIIRPDKSVRTLWAEAGELTHDAEGKPLLLAGYVQDITDRRQAEETLMKALKKNEALYRNLMENSIDAVYLLNREGTVLHVNRVASEMLGYSYAELLGLTISDIDINYPQQGFIDFWNKKPESSSILFETQHRHKNGTIIPVEVNGIFFTLEGEKTFFGVARMLRDRKD